MDGEILRRPEKPDRLSDIPHGAFEHCVDKLAEAFLSRKPFERLASDWQYARAVASFMRDGYDQHEVAELQKVGIEERRKNRRRLRGSGYDSGPVEEFCKLVFYQTRTFVRIAAWSLVQRIAQKDEGHSPTRQVLSTERLERFKALLPPLGEKNRGDTAIAMLADALVYSCRSAAEHAATPGGYKEYAKSIRHGGVGIDQQDDTRHELQDLVDIDPILFLELLSVAFCKLVVGRSNKKAQALHELLKPEFGIICLDFEACPELDIGEVINYFCVHVAEWRSLRESYPNPREHYTVEFCCRGMERLKERLYHKELLGLWGTLARGFRVGVFKDLNTVTEEVWFPSCPFCEKSLYTPPKARLYNKEKDKERLQVW